MSTVWTIILIAVLLAAGGVAAAVRQARRRRAVEQLAQAVDHLARDHFDQHTRLEAPKLLAPLAEAVNETSEQLRARIQSLIQQRNTLSAVLSSMAEGVIAVDAGRRIIELNAAAADLLGTERTAAAGRPISEVVRNMHLQAFISRTLASSTTIEDELNLYIAGETPAEAGREHHFQIRGTSLEDGQGRRIGAVIVLHDLTSMRRLETMRRDFVANVSHEIRTPVSVVRGSIETILDHPENLTEDDRRLLEMASRQAERLHAIVEDLLSLARVERDMEQERIDRRPIALRKVLEGAAEACRFQARDRRVRVEIDCPAEFQVDANPTLLEQAVVNLVQNAVRHSYEGGRVRLMGRTENGEDVVEVRDEGTGIAAEHLPRIFERFYRVDRGRSRQTGGTGLGLAIVKHIAIAHGGRVTVESRVGRGSAFAIRLPHEPTDHAV